jgi:hypothetical protein
MAESTILSITRIVQARGEYPATYRVMYERLTSDGSCIGPMYLHVNAVDELDAYRRARNNIEVDQIVGRTW